MFVQKTRTEKGQRYILLDDCFVPVDEVNRFLKFLDYSDCSPNTLKTYVYQLKQFYEYLGTINYLNLRLMFCDDKVNHFEILSNFRQYARNANTRKEIANATINIKLTAILGLVNFMKNNNEIDGISFTSSTKYIRSSYRDFLYGITPKRENSYKNVLMLKTIEPELKFNDRKQSEEAIKECKSIRDKTIVAILFETGMRIGELLGIHFEDLELENNVIYIVSRDGNINQSRVKNHSDRTDWVPDYVVDLITQYILYELKDYESDFLFVNLNGENKGKPMMYSTVYKLFKRLSSKLQYRTRPHMMRHGFATEKQEYRDENGKSIDQYCIKNFLGHKNIQTTDIYIHGSERARREALALFYKKMDINFGGKSND